MDEEEAQVKAFELQADDYITKPFSLKLVLMRIEAVLRRTKAKSENHTTLISHGIKLDTAEHTVKVNGTEIYLTQLEFDILEVFMKNPNRVLTRDTPVSYTHLDVYKRQEQALYYARSEYTEKDYSVQEIRLFDVVHQAIADNKYLLLQNQVSLEMEESELTVYSDEKWLRFILDQLIVNAVKYSREHPVLRFYTLSLIHI